MFEREKRAGKRLRRCFEGKSWHWLIILVLLSGCGTLSSGGTSTLATTPTPLPSFPQPTVDAGPFHTVVQTFDGDFTVTLAITPNRSGPNQFQAQVMDNHTRKPAIYIIMRLYTTMQDMPMGTDSIVLHAGGGGQFSATSAVLSMGGHWAIGITIQTADHVIHKAGVSFVMPR
jgi:hypothetical protein